MTSPDTMRQVLLPLGWMTAENHQMPEVLVKPVTAYMRLHIFLNRSSPHRVSTQGLQRQDMIWLFALGLRDPVAVVKEIMASDPLEAIVAAEHLTGLILGSAS